MTRSADYKSLELQDSNALDQLDFESSILQIVGIDQHS